VRRLVAVVLVSSILLSGCGARFTQNDSATVIQNFPSEVVEEVAKLPILDMSSVDSYQKYTEFADAADALIKLLNEKSNGTFKIPQIDVTLENFQKASRLITEYSPLINNYNDVVETAIQVNKGKSDIKEFYKTSAIFGLEVAVIFTGLFYPFSYDTVGVLYRAVGLNRFAVDCPSCVSFILSSAHWAIRTALVEESSKVAKNLLDGIQSAYESLSSNPIDKAMEFIKKHFGGN
jgi:hypothetical protein